MVGRILGMHGVFRQALSKGRTSLNHDELNNLLVEVKSIVNSRPLICVADDSEYCDSLPLNTV